MRFMFPGYRTLVTTIAIAVGVAGSSVAAEQFKDLFPKASSPLGQPTKQADPVVEARFSPETAQIGDEVTFSITVKVAPGSYTYSTNKSFGGGTKIKLKTVDGLEPVGPDFVADHEPKIANDEFLGRLEKFENEVTWSRKYRVTAAQAQIEGLLDYQVCDANTCKPLKTPFMAALAGALAGPVTNDSASDTPATFTSTVSPEYRGKPGPGTLTFRLSPENAQPGETVTVSVHLKLQDKWHTYSLTQKPGNAAETTTIKLDQLAGLKAVDAEFTPDSPPEIKHPLDEYTHEVHEPEVTWSRRFEVLSESYGVAGEIRYQVCDVRRCLSPVIVPFMLGAPASAAATVIAATDEGTSTGSASNAANNADQTPRDSEVIVNQADVNDPTREGLIPFLVFAIGAGFLALLTPCVFPMVPITVSFFLKQSESEHHRPVFMASVYCIGIMLTFTVLGLLMAAIFGAASLNTLANNPWLNLMIAAVMIFFGVNLLGMFEIRIPSQMLTWSSGKEGQGGIIGTLFMSLTFTLVSFTCTFAFAGLLLVWASKGQYYWPIVGMLAFSAAFSLPFFFLALFPSFLKKLPKSGGWMNTVKVTMGLIEFGAAFKFLSVADLAWNPTPLLFDYEFVMSAWLVISVLAGVYLLGMFRLPHDTPTDHVSVPRFVASIGFLGLASYLAVGLFSAESPRGMLWENIASFAPPRVDGGEGDIGPYIDHDGLKYALDVDQAVEFAQKNNKPLFFDFTGVNCVNCRKMERKMEQPQNRQLLENFVLVRLYTDNVPTIKDQEQVDALLQKNITRQTEWFGDSTLPAYVVVTPDGQTQLAAFVGLEQKDGTFAAFLGEGLQRWQEVDNLPETQRVVSR